MANEFILQAENLTKNFFTKKGEISATALKDFNFSMQKNSLTALIGPDGAGKTTFMRLICGLMIPTSGSLKFFGENIVGNEQKIQEKISYLPQRFGLYEDLTIEENLNLYADLHGIDKNLRKKRFSHLLEMTGLEKFTKRLAGKLSGGMKQKLGLACTLVRSPKLLLLDEPTVGVDPLSRRELWEIIKKSVAEENLSVLVNTAYMDEAELCNEVYILNHGKILMNGSPDEIKKIAQSRCFIAESQKNIPVRILQSFLLDDKENIVDAVPEAGRVQFITQKFFDEKKFSEKINLPIKKISECLEDAFMILLHDDEKISAKNFVPIMDTFHCEYKISKKIDIEVRDLVKKFGNFTAVDKTSFQVHQGEVFGLLGPNGAGKTTTFRMLCGLLPLTSGFLSVAGVNLRTARTQARINIGYVAQKFKFFRRSLRFERKNFAKKNF